MAYATITDLPLGWGADEATRSADRDGDGSADTGVQVYALDDASAEIDGYLAKVYELPLAEPYPSILRRLAVDIAIYRMSPSIGALTDEKRRRYDDAIRQLEKIAAGELDLVGPNGAPPAVGAVVEWSAESRQWTRDLTGSGGIV